MNLTNKTALITGGGSGIGFAIASALAAEGTNIILASRRIDLLRRRAEQLHTHYHVNSYAYALDLRDRGIVDRASQEFWSHFSVVVILVNNSGIGVDAEAVTLREEDWDRVIDTNLKGAFLLSQAVLPKMIAQRSGHIINISSQAGKNGYANATAYCASKFGLIGFGQALQQEVRQHNIKVTNLLPALVQVPPPSGEGDLRTGVLQVEDLAQAAVYVLKQPDRVKIEDIGLYHI
jgi:NADP-dependent 3-hydroxy acid dehydrogenase YdfG